MSVGLKTSFTLCYIIFELALKIQNCINTLDLVLQVCGGCRCDYDSEAQWSVSIT